MGENGIQRNPIGDVSSITKPQSCQLEGTVCCMNKPEKQIPGC